MEKVHTTQYARTKKLLLLASASLLLGASLNAQDLTIISDFTGNGTTTTGYAGIAGDGWLGKWNANKVGNGSFGGNVVSQKLRMTNSNNTSLGISHDTLNRSYGASVIDYSREYSINFSTNFTNLTNFNSGDYIGFLEGGGNTRGTPNSSELWGVYIDGADGSINWYDSSQGIPIQTGLFVDT